MARRKGSTIGSNPLDVVVPQRVEKPAGSGERTAPPAAPPARARSAGRPETPRKRRSSVPEPTQQQDEARAVGKKERLTVHVPLDLVDRVKNAVYWTPGLTLARMAEEALEAEVERREKGQGGPFPTRAEELRGGRPMK